MLVLLDDDQGRMTLQRLRPWHRMLARTQAARLDRELAGGASPALSRCAAWRCSASWWPTALARSTARPAGMIWAPSSNGRPAR